MTSTESENNRSDRDRHDVAQSSAGESSPLRPQYAKVTLTVTLYERDEAYADLVRQTLPNATERTEVETVQLDPSPADTPGQIDQTDEVPLPSTSRTQRLRIFQCTYSDIPLAHEASRLLPVWVQRRVEAAAELDEEEIEALYEYHAREVLSYGHWTGEVEWDLEELGRYYYHCGRSQALEQILGETRARSIFDRAYEPFNPTFYGVRESELNFDLEIDDPPLETDDDGHIKV